MESIPKVVVPATLLAAALLLGCERGVVKGPVGQGGQGVGMKVPVLDLLNKESYSTDQFTPENLDEKAVNPFGGKQDVPPSKEPFSRYDERTESF